MSTLTFLNSPLLWGLVAASIPLLIHLLYRRQYRRVDWAPMRYLKLSIQRNRRRIRIEQLLLLLLRTAVVVLLFLLVARPVMHAEGLSRWWGGTGRTNRIVLLDDSLSMGYTHEGKTALSRGQALAADLLATFGPQDGLTLVLASAPNEPLLREVTLDELDDLVRVVREVEPADTLSAWDDILQSLQKLVDTGSYPLHEITLITDLRRAGWEAELETLGSQWATGRVRLRVFDVGRDDTSNVALLSLEQADRLALAGTSVRFEARVRNDTFGELVGQEANLIVDGKPSLVRLPNLAAGETVTLPLLATFQEPGAHDVAFELASDAMAGDNRRSAVVDVRAGVNMLLVDGEPSSEALGGETDFLALALSLAGDAADAFQVEVLTDAQWASTPATSVDLLVLANVARLTPEQAEALEQQVRDGLGLMIFVGDQVDPDNYNQVLYKGGAGILPSPLEAISDVEFAGLLAEPLVGSPLESLGQLTPAALARVKVRRTYELAAPQGKPDQQRVLARWNNAGATPAVVEKVVGRGHVLLWTTAADRSWSDWPTEPSYVLAVREAARAVARSTAAPVQYTAGQPLRLELPSARDIVTPTIETPGQKDPRPLVQATPTAAPNANANADGSSAARVLEFDDTRRAGLYTMRWRDSVTGPANRAYAVNPDRRESELERWPLEEFRRAWGVLEPEVVSLGGGADASLAVHGQEIWRTLAFGLMGLLVVEACFARWAGRQH